MAGSTGVGLGHAEDRQCCAFGVLPWGREAAYFSGVESINFKRDLSAFLQVSGGLAVLALMLLGVGGTIYKTLAPNGWLTLLLRTGLPDSLAATSALLVMCGFAWLTREWRTPRTRSWVIDLLVYAFACAGLLYAAQLLINGGL